MDSKLFTAYVNGTSYIQKMLETRPLKSIMAQAVLHENAFGMHLYSNGLMFLEACFWTKLLSTVHNNNCGVRLGYLVKVVLRAWNACTQAAGLGRTQIALQLYMFYDNGIVIFEVSRGEGYAPRRQ